MFKTYRNLKSLHSLYEQNFVLANKLSGELNRHQKFTFQVGNLENKTQVTILKKRLSKFTDELEFKIKCSTYNEPKMMEVIEYQNFHKDLLSIFNKVFILVNNPIFVHQHLVPIINILKKESDVYIIC